MIIKSINTENLKIDEPFKSIEELKNLIYKKYKYPIGMQNIIYNGKFFVFGLFENILYDLDSNSPLSEFGVPSEIYKKYQGSKEKIFPEIKESIDNEEKLEQNIFKINEVKYEDVDKFVKKMSEEEKDKIIKNIDSYLKQIFE